MENEIYKYLEELKKIKELDNNLMIVFEKKILNIIRREKIKNILSI